MSEYYSRGMMLAQQNRADLAADEFKKALAINPNDAKSLFMLALCYCDLGKQLTEALRLARQGLGQEPDNPFAHYTHGTVLYELDREKEAEQAFLQALELDPEDPDIFAKLAALAIDRKDWKTGLDRAEAGLALDPEHTACNNLRAIALVKLGRRREAGATLESTLSRDPDDSVSHANMGWTRLESGEHKQALEHFREALRINPNNEWAREGILEALRARYFFYALLLKYMLFMSRLSDKAQWAVIIGLYIGYRVLRSVQKNNPEWEPYVLPLIVLYFVVVGLTWLGKPIANLLVRLNRFGRLALPPREVHASTAVGVCLLLGTTCLILWPVTGAAFWIPAIYFFAMTIPMNTTISAPTRALQWKLGIYALVLAALGPAALAVWLLGGGDFTPLVFAAFVLGWVGFSWYANFVLISAKR